MHSYYSNTNNTFEDSSYPIFLAEIASTVNEVLLNKYMYEHSDKKDEKLFSLYIDTEKLKQLKILSVEKNKSLKDLINEAIEKTYF